MSFLFPCCQILIEGTVGDDFNGDIAIDDLSFLDCDPYEGKLVRHNTRDELTQFRPVFVCVFPISTVDLCFLPCPVLGELPVLNTTIPTVTTPAPTVQPHSCPDGEFVCGTHGECVPQSKECNFRPDCSDGSDEINCGKMSFPL